MRKRAANVETNKRLVSCGTATARKEISEPAADIRSFSAHVQLGWTQGDKGFSVLAVQAAAPQVGRGGRERRGFRIFRLHLRSRRRLVFFAGWLLKIESGFECFFWSEPHAFAEKETIQKELKVSVARKIGLCNWRTKKCAEKEEEEWLFVSDARRISIAPQAR